MEAAAIILSGGKSSRMGTNKSFLKINDKLNIEIIRDKLRLHFDDIILVTNDTFAYEFLGVKVVQDQFPGFGPLAGLHAGLMASSLDVNFVVACDMPFISTKLADALISRCGNYDAVVPVINGKLHPLFAVYKKEIAREAAKCMESSELRMKHLLHHIHVQYVTEKDLTGFSHMELERIFFNMNYPQDYQDAKKWAEAD